MDQAWGCIAPDGRRLEHRRGLSRVAVKGGGSGGGGSGMYRAVATHCCGWGHRSQGPGLGIHGSQGRKCGWVQEVLDRACVLVVVRCCRNWRWAMSPVTLV